MKSKSKTEVAEEKISLSGRRLVAFFLIIAFGVMVAWLYEARLVIAITNSLDHRIFMRKFFHGKALEIKKGDYVIFSLEHDRHALPEYKLLKKVVCVEGETLKVTPDKRYYCNGVYLCKAKDRSLKGEKLDNFVFNGRIPPGKIFVMGHHKDSYDSRYFGFIPRSIVRDVAYPVW